MFLLFQVTELYELRYTKRGIFFWQVQLQRLNERLFKAVENETEIE